MSVTQGSFSKIIIVGGGVAGSEAGTYLGHQAKHPLDIIEIDAASHTSVVSR